MQGAVIALGILAGVLSAGVLAALTKIHTLKKAARAHLFTDEQTSLFNRDGFLNAGKTLLEELPIGKNAAMVVFDIEQFGKTTALFGSDVGDNVICGFAEAVSSAADSFPCGRFNTDDFGVLISFDNEREIDCFISRVQEHISEKFTGTSLLERLNFRAGIAIYDGCDDILTLFNKATLCTISKDGSKVTRFTSELENRMVENEFLRTEMLTALAEGQFEQFYQPKICFNTQSIIGVEALIRWHHPVKGFVSPAEFIPLAEQTGIITQIDEWGLRTACRQCKAWQEQGLPPVKISVNMSQAQFYRTDVVTTVKNVLEETGLDPQWLEIEVTETMAMHDIDRTVNILSTIRDMGVSVSMDDFGSGYSSLSSLKTLPLDILKIDRSLVCDLDENETSRRITGAIVELGKAMKLIILAEGVETTQQCEFLTEIGCDLAQGYYYSKPRTADEISAILMLPLKNINKTNS